MTSLTSRLTPLHRAWLAREPRKRRTLTLGGVLIVLLLAYLTVTRLGGHDTAIEAPAVRPVAPDLPPLRMADDETWRAAAAEHGITLEGLTTGAQRVRLEGHIEQPAAVVEFARWASRRGWWTTDWSLSRGDEEVLRLEMTLVAELEQLPAGRRAH